MRISLTTVVCALLLCATTKCQEIKWREITIESRHGGLEVSRDLRLVIESHNDVIVSGRHGINPDLVKKLIASLTSPMLPAPTPSNLGITDAWLKQNVPTLLEGAANQKTLFQDSFTDSKTVADLVPFAFKFMKFDDYPQLSVTISLKDGGQWVCSFQLLLPIYVALEGQSRRQ